VIDPPKSSRRAAAVRTHAVGESAGAAGPLPFPANGFNMLLTKFTTTLDTGLDGPADTVTGATDVAVCIDNSALDVTSPLVAVDGDNTVETGVAARPANTRGLDSQALRDGTFTTASLAAGVVLGATFFETAVGEDAGLTIPLAGVASSPLAPLVPVSDDASDVDLAAGCAEVDCVVAVEFSEMAVDCWSPAAPALPDGPELVCAPPVLTTSPGGADLVARWVVETAPESDPDGVLLRVDEFEELCVDPGARVEPDSPAEAVDSDDVDDEAAEAGSAEATPYPVRVAVPTPRATASPTTRPIYRAAPNASSWTGDQSQQTLASPSPAQTRFKKDRRRSGFAQTHPID
jgi:hypothetical protein